MPKNGTSLLPSMEGTTKAGMFNTKDTYSLRLYEQINQSRRSAYADVEKAKVKRKEEAKALREERKNQRKHEEIKSVLKWGNANDIQITTRRNEYAMKSSKKVAFVAPPPKYFKQSSDLGYKRFAEDLKTNNYMINVPKVGPFPAKTSDYETPKNRRISTSYDIYNSKNYDGPSSPSSSNNKHNNGGGEMESINLQLNQTADIFKVPSFLAFNGGKKEKFLNLPTPSFCPTPQRNTNIFSPTMTPFWKKVPTGDDFDDDFSAASTSDWIEPTSLFNNQDGPRPRSDPFHPENIKSMPLFDSYDYSSGDYKRKILVNPHAGVIHLFYRRNNF